MSAPTPKINEKGLLVLKIGGAPGPNLTAIAEDLAQLGRPTVILHGLSGVMAELAATRGQPQRMLTSPSGHRYRHTDAATRDLLVEAALQFNTTICAELRASQLRPRSLTAKTALVLQARRKSSLRAVIAGRTRVIRDDYSGHIEGVAVAPLRAALAAGELPVLPPLAASDDGPLNVDGDRAAAAVAVALGAEGLLILSNVHGLYRHYPKEASLVRELSRSRLPEALTWAQGRMKRKVLGAQEALAGGLRWVRISDGRQPHPLTAALAGDGTCFHA